MNVQLKLVAAMATVVVSLATGQGRAADAAVSIRAAKQLESDTKAEVDKVKLAPWDFGPVAHHFKPVKGTHDPVRKEVTWVLELQQDMGGTVGSVTDSPLAPQYLDADGVAIAHGLGVMSVTTGRKGDRIRVVFSAPADMNAVKSVKVGPRTGLLK